jgi:hypothetical protein
MAAIPDREGGDFLNFGLDQRWGEAQPTVFPYCGWSKNGGQVIRNGKVIAFKEEDAYR